jgi:hypothetical protein
MITASMIIMIADDIIIIVMTMMIIKKKKRTHQQRQKKNNSELERSTDQSKARVECETETDATGRLSRPFQKFSGVIPTKPSSTELQKLATVGTAHILGKTLM